MKKIASVFRDILQDEKSHEDELAQKYNKMMNLRTSIKGEFNKIETIKSVMDQAEKEKNSRVVAKLRAMLDEEQGHVEKLSKALEGLEEEMRQMKKAKKEMEEEPRELCTYGVCVPKPKGK